MWDDHDANMLWLDSDYPLDKDPSTTGVNRGTCPTVSGDPVDMEENYPDATVKYFNVKFGTIGSTYQGEMANQQQQLKGKAQTPPQPTQDAPETTCLTACPCAPQSHWTSSKAVFWSARTSAHKSFRDKGPFKNYVILLGGRGAHWALKHREVILNS